MIISMFGNVAVQIQRTDSTNKRIESKLLGGYCSGLRDNCGLMVIKDSGDEEEVIDRGGTFDSRIWNLVNGRSYG